MQFNDTSTRTGLIQDSEDMCSLGATGISGNTILLQTFTRYINNWYLKAIAWVLESNPKWQFDDSNYTDLPRAYTTMVAAQRDYTLPPATVTGNADTFLRLIKLACLDLSGNEYQIVHSDLPESQLLAGLPTSGRPQFYKLTGASLKLFPAPAASGCTLTAGLICYFERSIDLFTSSDTTQHPGLPEPFHRILSLGASYDYMVTQGNTTKAKLLREEIEVLKAEIQKFGIERNKDVKIRVSPRRERYA